MEKHIKEIYKKITNPSGIVMCLYSRGISGKFTELRKYVIKEIDRLSKQSQTK